MTCITPSCRRYCSVVPSGNASRAIRFQLAIVGLLLTRPTDLSYGVCQMNNAPSIGQFEQLVLTAVLSLREQAYGVSIQSRVAELAAPKAVSLGAVYVTLDRLEDKGFVTSWLSDPTPERGGRAKRCYQLQALGERALRQSAESIHRMHEVLSEAWGDRRWKPARIR